MKCLTIVLLILSLLAVAVPTTTSAQGPTQITLWRHETGDDEVKQNEEAIARFNASQDDWEVVYEKLPQGTYTESITAAALAGDLPCIFDMDQPTVPNFAWSGHVRPLGELIDAAVLDQITTGGKGTYKGEVYSIGQFDVALTIFARQSILDEYDVRVPTVDEPWALDEFNEILETFAASGEFDYALDVNGGWSGEWASYAYGPMLQSFGGDLIDRSNYIFADGVLNGPEAVAWGEWFQNLFASGLVNPTPPDGEAFRQGRVPLHYTGSWDVNNNTDVFGDDLLFLPVPDYGNGSVIGAGSWQWGISTSCEHPEGAAAYLTFLMQPEEVADMVTVTGLIPTTEAGAALTENYQEDGKWRAFYEYAAKFAIVRPETPAYPIISSAFERVALGIRDGGDVQALLDEAVDTIEIDIADNNGYGYDM